MLTAERKMERIARAKRHVAADMLTAGTYWNNGSGCSVGCDAHEISPDPKICLHAIVARHDGTPEWLEWLRDAIFEGLPDDKLAWWHVALAEAIPVDTDLQPYCHKIMAGVVRMGLRYADTWDEAYRQQVVDAIETIAKLHDRGSAPTFAEWSAAEGAAWIAADSAASSSAEVMGTDVDRSARSAAESAAESTWTDTNRCAASCIKNATDCVAWSTKTITRGLWPAERASRLAKNAAETAAYLEIAELTIRILAD